jgi:hypothetical protein
MELSISQYAPKMLVMDTKFTPKDKALDLWLNYYEITDAHNSPEWAKKQAKEQATIAIDEMIFFSAPHYRGFLELVKEEINNI